MEKLYSHLVKLNSLQFKYRTILSFVLVLIAILLSDILFHIYFPFIVDILEAQFNIKMTDHQNVPLDWAPEIWGGVLAMVLGTLIIVIAIAAESSTKLMEWHCALMSSSAMSK